MKMYPNGTLIAKSGEMPFGTIGYKELTNDPVRAGKLRALQCVVRVSRTTVPQFIHVAL